MNLVSLYIKAYKLRTVLFGWKSIPGSRIFRKLESKIIMRFAPNPIQWDQLVLYWDASTWFHIRTLLSGNYEPHILPFYRNLIRPGNNVVDIGAHIGIYTLIAASEVHPTGKVYAFEPDPRVYALLVKNIEANGFQSVVRTLPIIVSDEMGTQRFYLSPHTGASSVWQEWAGSSNFIDVKRTTLDRFFASEDWPPVQLIKIDAEGSEISILKGMRELVSRNPSIKVLFELNFLIMEKIKIELEDFLVLLKTLGFSYVYLISTRGIRKLQSADDFRHARYYYSSPHFTHYLLATKEDIE